MRVPESEVQSYEDSCSELIARDGLLTIAEVSELLGFHEFRLFQKG
jgi:hypothetical protein